MAQCVPEPFISLIQRDFPVATTWIPGPFATGLRVRPDGNWRMGGSLPEFHAIRWLNDPPSLHACPDWVGQPAR
jgi:hypothetical protein